MSDYPTARCGQLSIHAPHVVDHGPDQPRNCPGVYATGGIINPVDGESTSARLRRVEQERDEAREQLTDAVTIAVRAGVQRDQVGEMWETGRQAHELTLAELASAKTELGHLRRERDQLRADLTAALEDLQDFHRDKP